MNKWKENIRKVTPYVPGEQPKDKDIIKLNTNENPFPPSKKVSEIHEKMEIDKFRLYPDPEASHLVEELEKYHNLEKGQVFVGVGSDDVLSLAFLTFFNSNKPILFPDITYSFYPVWANVYRIPYETKPLDKNFKINIEDYKNENGGIVIANPNAPTSLQLGLEKIEEIIKANSDVIVIVDEAYVDFGGESVLPLLEKYENLLIVRTFSKSRSLAGMRIGYAMGGKELINAMKAVKESINSYTMTRESIEIGVASLLDDDYFKEKVNEIIKIREKTKEALEELNFKVLDSKTNFLFAKPSGISAGELFEKLREKKIFVRFFNKDRINEYLRITIGTKEQMEKFIEEIKGIINY